MAALRFAKENKTVAVVSKGKLEESNSWWAQGGLSAVPVENGQPLKGDSFEEHVNDTLKAGAGLCDRNVVEQFVEKAFTHSIEPMIEAGVKFTKATDSTRYPYSLHQEGGHSAPRIFHVADHTGRSIMEALIARVKQTEQITIYEDHMAIDLITHHRMQGMSTELSAKGETLIQRSTSRFFDVGGGKRRDHCLGAYVLDVKKDKVEAFAAQATFLATGGAGRVYLYTSNPDTATGDGIAMYSRLGYPIVNMEFMQFHPTCFYNPNPKFPDQRRFLITEALRGKTIGKGILTLSKDSKEDFVKTEGYDPVMGSASTRDVVAKAIDTEMKRRGMPHVWLNITPEVTGKTAEQIMTGYPVIYAHCLECGIDITKQPIPVVPASHYTCGGIPVDMDGCTQVGRLYAVGECANTGLHGANRLASNSLSEAALYGVQAADHAMQYLDDEERFWVGVPEWQVGLAKQSRDEIQVAFHWSEVRHLMWHLVGIARTAERLQMAKTRIELILEEVTRYYWNFYVTKDLLELRNITMVAEIIIHAALARPESRGGHCRLDAPPIDQSPAEQSNNGRSSSGPWTGIGN
uniref:L-aspartate oxidase n=1 Tax=Eutreptiella gymnastica TaxID=73025 RepID=A0A7S1JHL1_9EUGL